MEVTEIGLFDDTSTLVDSKPVASTLTFDVSSLDTTKTYFISPKEGDAPAYNGRFNYQFKLDSECTTAKITSCVNPGSGMLATHNESDDTINTYIPVKFSVTALDGSQFIRVVANCDDGIQSYVDVIPKENEVHDVVVFEDLPYQQYWIRYYVGGKVTNDELGLNYNVLKRGPSASGGIYFNDYSSVNFDYDPETNITTINLSENSLIRNYELETKIVINGIETIGRINHDEYNTYFIFEVEGEVDEYESIYFYMTPYVARGYSNGRTYYDDIVDIISEENIKGVVYFPVVKNWD